MTLILCYPEEHGIRLFGDSGRNLGGGPLPATIPPAPKKVQRCPRATIAGALYGDLPIQYNANCYQPDLWFEAFLATIDQNCRIDTVVQSLLFCLQHATFCGAANGGIILAGFEQRELVLYEIEAKQDPNQAVNHFTPIRINETDLRARPLVRGLSCRRWEDVQALCRCGPLTTQSCSTTYRQAIEALAFLGQPVAEPITEVFIELNPLFRPNLRAPAPGSLAPPPVTD